MASTAGDVLRQRMGVAIWPFSQTFTTTSIGNAGGTTLVCTGITEIPDSLDQMYVIMTSGDSDAEIQRVSSVSTSTITVETAFTAQIASGVTFEIHRFYPTLMTNSLDRAAADLLPWLYVHIRNETIIVDNLITNFDFETFAGSVFTGWTHTAGTWTQETSRIVHGSNSARGVASGADAQLTQDLFTSVNIHEAVGKTLRFEAWVWATAASVARLRVTFDGGTTFTNAEYHGGKDQWQGFGTMFINVPIPEDATSVTLYLEVADGNTAYFDLVACNVLPIMRYTVPTAIVEGPYRIEMQDNLQEPDGHFRILQEGEKPRPGSLLRMIGKGQLSTLTTDASTVEIGEPQTQLLIARALHNMYRNLSQATAVERDLAELYRQNADDWANEERDLIRRPDIALSGMSAEYPRPWSVSEDSSGRYVTFRW